MREIQKKLQKLYTTLQEANIDSFIDKKNTGKITLDYLSWGAAVDFFTKGCHELELDWDYCHSFESMGDAGSFVTTTITITDGTDTITKRMTLPCMTHTNQAEKNPDVMCINKTQMRCLVKCMTLFGLGLKLYLKNFDELTDVKTGQQRADDNAKKIATMKEKIKTMLNSLDPAVDTSMFANYETCDDAGKLTAMGIALKKICDTQGANNENN